MLEQDGSVATWTPGAERLTGYRADEILGKHFAVFYTPEDIAAGIPAAMLQEARQSGRSAQDGWHIIKDGARLWASMILTTLPNQDGRVCVLVKAMHDVAVPPMATSAIRSEAGQRGLRRSSADVIKLIEMSVLLQSCATVDEVMAPIAHYGQELFPSTSGALYLMRASMHAVVLVASWGDHQESKGFFTLDNCWGLRRGGIHVSRSHDPISCNHFPLVAEQRQQLCVPMMAHSETIGVLCLQGNADRLDAVVPIDSELAVMMADQIALAVANLKLRETLQAQSIRDPLTRLYNRRHLEDSLKRELARAARTGAAVYLLMLDIDHFKSFNDTYGHDAGDAVLRAFGRLLERQFRRSDLVCRYGGEEFTIVLLDSPAKEATAKAEQLLHSVSQMEVDHRDLIMDPITTSIGIAAFPADGDNMEALIHAADRALYSAKLKGRNRIEHFANVAP